MSLLIEFLKLFLRIAPEAFDAVKQGLGEMVTHGYFTEERKEKLIEEIRPTKDKEIDAEIDKQVAEKFPKDKETVEEEVKKEDGQG